MDIMGYTNPDVSQSIYPISVSFSNFSSIQLREWVTMW